MSTPLRRAALLVGLEGGVLVLLGVGYGVAGVVGEPFDRLATILEALLTVVLGAGLLLVARALAAARRWAMAPAVLAQLLALPVGVGLVQGEVWYAAAPVLLLAIAVLAHLAAPSARAAFE